MADLVAEAPSLLLLDRRDRGDFLRSFYRRYEGAPVDRLRDDGWELFHHLLLAKSFPDGFARVRQHRALGHRTVLITGALDLVVEPLRPLFDAIVCARLGEEDGAFTGRLEELRPSARPGPWYWPSTPRRRVCSSRSRWPTPIRPATCRCWRPWASRWPSTRRPSWPPSPGGGVGTSSTGTRPRGVPSRSCPSGPVDRRGSLGEAGPAPPLWPVPVRRLQAERAVKALVFERNLPRFAASRVASLLGSGRGAGIGPLQLLETSAPELPGQDWFHLTPLLSGICGSDLATLDGRSSRYFEDLVSFPFVPGHEVVGLLETGGRTTRCGTAPGTRAVIEPVLGCAPRHIDPPCP